ncbi:hypothetical protein ACF064_34905 [Streptomyces sp. NPDC015492]|uniref:hypothetical protein n=1 Tax=Streptomyces sp. NPDC015492 TaxID=3364958 RepID=UPI0036F97ABD
MPNDDREFRDAALVGTWEKVFTALLPQADAEGDHAKVGKHLRAEPIAQLCSQGLVHHVGVHPRLEGQLVTWIPGMDSPDRMDAAVQALTELADPAAVSTGSGSYTDQRLAGRR